MRQEQARFLLQNRKTFYLNGRVGVYPRKWNTQPSILKRKLDDVVAQEGQEGEASRKKKKRKHKERKLAENLQTK
ncbi:hypothetical protein H0H87_002076 [Tephrocybe sp. NHM501043]|nr:hypothetical protein H0H87_002076 [Tephrocybe sp. NHM501043]